MKITNVDRAVQLKKEINELIYFIEHVSVGKQKYFSSVLRIKTQHIYSIRGVRDYGGGCLSSEIKIPSHLVDDLNKIARKRLKELEIELDQL